MTERQTVLVDMDGVLANFHLGVIDTIAYEQPYIDTHRPYTHFYVAEDFPEVIDLAKDISDRPGFFSSLKVIDGAIEGWYKLQAAGYHPRICSSPLKSHPNSKGEKLQWLESNLVPHFGPHIIDEAHIVGDKTACEGIALIDDKPTITGNSTPSWQHIMFTQSYNVSRTVDYRINSWHDERLIPILGYLATKHN